MTPAYSRIYQATLMLPESERLRLVRMLLESIEPDEQAALDGAWCTELDRRLADFRQGRADDVSWSDLRNEE